MTLPAASQDGRQFDFAADIERRARHAVDHHDGHPEPAWSTGERLTVALVLGDEQALTAEGYTWEQAEQRLAGDLGFYGYADSPGTWLDKIRAAVLQAAPMAALSEAAKLALRDAGIPAEQWARANYMRDGKWCGDACGCPDDRCIGYHHLKPDDCSCLRVLIADYLRWARGAKEVRMFDEEARPVTPSPREAAHRSPGEANR